MELRTLWTRAFSSLVLSALVSLAACSGGTGGGGVLGPTMPNANLKSPALSFAAFPRTAPAGVRIFVHLPLRNSAQLDTLIADQTTKSSPLYRHWLTPAQFREQFGPLPQNLEAVASALQGQGFTTAITSQGVVADAPQAVVERTFNIHLSRRTFAAALSRGNAATTMLAADRAPTLPAALSRLGAHVAAFAPLPPLHSDSFVTALKQIPSSRLGPFGGYWFDDLKQAYKYPSYRARNGSGVTIALTEASDFLDSDMAAYFGHEGLAAPTIVRRPVDGGPPAFSPSNGAALEASLDIQQSGGSAPGATIVVYGAPDLSIVPSFLDQLIAIVDDNVADVASNSAGLCELEFTAAYAGTDLTFLEEDFHDVYRQGNAQGITFVNASGDFGAYGCTDPTGATAILGVEFPDNDPDVTGVGGTNLETTFVPGSLESNYVSENAFYNAFAPGPGIPTGLIFGSGGGKSTFWAKPLYQYFVNTREKVRTVPDVAMHMGGCPVGAVQPCSPDHSFDFVVFGGGLFGVIGTSAAAPEFAGLQALQDETLGGRVGNANYLLYALARQGSVGNGPIFHDHIPGDNGYKSLPGYNLVVGNGTPYAAQYALDPFAPLAGNPQTPSNP
jgi:subtilase family serine protease